MAAAQTPTRSRRLQVIPNQHGAWAFLIVPLVLGFAVSGWSWPGLTFATAWVAAYPLSFFATRGTRAWLRRRTLTAASRRDRKAALIWLTPCAAAGLAAATARPQLLIAAAVGAILWGISLSLAVRGNERGMANDLLLISQAVCAVPLLWAVTTNSWNPTAFPTTVWLLTALCLAYFVGSVIHVKSLIRKAAEGRWHWFNIGYHAVALPVMTLLAPTFVIPFCLALVRSVALRPRTRPAVIGAVELVVSLSVLGAGVWVART